jgi:hypothetical protein
VPVHPWPLTQVTTSLYVFNTQVGHKCGALERVKDFFSEKLKLFFWGNNKEGSTNLPFLDCCWDSFRETNLTKFGRRGSRGR